METSTPWSLLELGHEPLDDRLVPVVAAEVVVARGRLDLEHAVADLEDRDVEGAAAEVEDEDRLVGGLLVEPVGERGGGRLVDDPLDLEPGDLAGVLGRLALVVVEVGGDGDHRRVDRLAELRLGVGLQLLEDHRRDLRRRVLLAADLHADVAVGAGDDLVRDDRLLLLDLGLLAAHEALDREDRVLGVHHRLALGHRADEALAGVGERDDGRGGAPALGVLEDLGLAALEHGHAEFVVPRSIPIVFAICFCSLKSLQTKKSEREVIRYVRCAINPSRAAGDARESRLQLSRSGCSGGLTLGGVDDRALADLARVGADEGGDLLGLLAPRGCPWASGPSMPQVTACITRPAVAVERLARC